MLIDLNQYQSQKQSALEEHQRQQIILDLQEQIETLKEDELFQDTLVALNELEQYIDHLPPVEQGEHAFNMALCLKKIMEETGVDHYEAVIEWLDRSLNIYPHSAATLQNRGNIYAELELFDRALLDYSEAIKLTPNDPELYFYKGITYEDLEQYAEAISCYTVAIKLDPADAVYHYNRGILYDKTGNLHQALNDFNRAIELFPEYADALNNRGLVYEQMERYVEAVLDFTAAIQNDPDNSYLYLNNRGNVRSALGNLELAGEDYRQALERNPFNPDPYLNLMELSLTSNPEQFPEHYAVFKEHRPTLPLSGSDLFMVDYLKLTHKMLRQKQYTPLLEQLEAQRSVVELTWSFKDLNRWLDSAPLPPQEVKLLQSLQSDLEQPLPEQKQTPWLRLF